MIQRALLFAAVCFLSLMTVSCGYFQAAEQRNKLKDVRVGMTKTDVAAIAGDPLTRELYSTDNLWFYYTDPKWYDGMITHDECTPFVFDDDGVLTGWGVEFYQKTRTMSSWTQKSINSAVWF